jgi:predicted house-cleaning NTP pyrophosphatase (Maf/HAM1 superfamily)
MIKKLLLGQIEKHTEYSHRIHFPIEGRYRVPQVYVRDQEYVKKPHKYEKYNQIIEKQFGKDLHKLSALTQVMDAIDRSPTNSFQLSDLDQNSIENKKDLAEIFAILGLLSSSRYAILKMVLRNRYNEGREISLVQFERLMQSWITKKISDEEWNEQAGDIMVSWILSKEEEE